MIPWRVVTRNLSRHPLRSILTIGSLAIAVFLLATLHSVVRALDAQIEAAEDDRIITQSAVSLFVNLPTSYQPKIAAVEGVEHICKWLWFGGYYQVPENFFGQFATDPETLPKVYPEIELVEGSYADFVGRRTACIIGLRLANDFGWKVGDRVPITGTIFRRTDGGAFEFDVAGIYDSEQEAIDKRTLFFHFTYLDEMLEQEAASGPRGTSMYSIKLAPGADVTTVTASVDALFENGPQKTDTVPESVFNSQFVSMWGNVPLFVSTIGLGVLLAVLLAVLNTMLLAARQQTHDIGVLKALGFTDATTAGVLLGQSVFLALVGGGIGLALATALSTLAKGTMQTFLPGFGLRAETVQIGVVLTVAVGLLAGVVPALRAFGLRPVEALRSEG